MSKKTKKSFKRNDVRYIACALEYFLDNIDLGEEIAQFVGNNQKRVAQIDWEKVSAEKILKDKDFREYLLDMINSALGDMQAMGDLDG